MEKNNKPRWAEVLWVEEDEEWTFPGRKETFRVHDGYLESKTVNLPWSKYSYWQICDIINHPEKIIRAPRLTEAELERCRVYGAKWVSRDDITRWSRISLYREKPVKIGNSFFAENTDEMIVSVWDETMFPSVHPGDCICVEEAGGDA